MVEFATYNISTFNAHKVTTKATTVGKMNGLILFRVDRRVPLLFCLPFFFLLSHADVDDNEHECVTKPSINYSNKHNGNQMLVMATDTPEENIV